MNKIKNKIRILVISLALLIISLPLCLAQEYNRVFDANGNLISDGTYYREYNALNQLVRVRLGNTSASPIAEDFVYHPLEERVVIKRIYNNSILKQTIHYVNENYISIINSSGVFNETYVLQDGILVAQVDTQGNKQAVHADHEGSTSLITNSAGNLVQNTFFSPYGEILAGGSSSRFDYEGKEFDSVTGLYDFHFRQFDPSIPVSDRPDTIIQNPYNPQALNHYMFELGNPYRNVDEDGHIVWDILDAYDFARAWEAYQTNPSRENKRNLIMASTGIIPGIPNLKRIESLLRKIPGSDKYLNKLIDATSKHIGKWFSKNKGKIEISDAKRIGTKGQYDKLDDYGFKYSKSADFRNKDLLADHFERHGKQMGYETQEAYQQGAQKFMTGSPGPNTAEMVRPSDGSLVRYDFDTQSIGVLDADGSTIKTYLRPSDDPTKSYQYYLNQVNR